MAMMVAACHPRSWNIGMKPSRDYWNMVLCTRTDVNTIRNTGEITDGGGLGADKQVSAPGSVNASAAWKYQACAF